MIKAVSDIVECLDQAKRAKSMQELLPVMMLVEPLEEALHSFFENKLKPIHDAIERGEDPFPNKESSEKPKDFDWNEYLKHLKPGEAN
jgi:hypothetical protein